MNLSSLERVELLSALEDRYQIDLSETRFSAVNTVGDLQRMLKGETAPRAVYHYPAWVQGWPTTWLRFIIHYLLLRPAVFLLGWPRILGRENLRSLKGPALVICNHIGDVDVGFILTALPARFRHKLATAAGGTVKLWDSGSGKEVCTLTRPAPMAYMLCLAISWGVNA